MDASGLYPYGCHPVYTNCLPDGHTPAQPLSRRHKSVKYYFRRLYTAEDLKSKEHLLSAAKSAKVSGVEGKARPDDARDIAMLGGMLRKYIYEVSVRFVVLSRNANNLLWMS